MKTKPLSLIGLPLTWLFASTAAIHGAVPAGTQAQYRFDGNANDSSGNGNHGINTGGIFVPDRFGNPASAIYFPGSLDRVDLPTGLFSGSAGSVSFWIKSDTVITGTTGQGSLYPFWVFGTRPDDSSPTPGEDLITIFFGDGTLVMESEMFGVVGGNGVHPRAANSTTEFGYLDTAWHHVALTSSPFGFQLYFDGVEWIPTMFTDGVTPASNIWAIVDEIEVKIGGNDSSDEVNKPFAVDDFLIADRAFTREEVLELFHGVDPEAVPETTTYATLAFVALMILCGHRRASNDESRISGSQLKRALN